MTKDQTETIQTENLVWMDLEMSGLEPANNTILEIATIITNPQLEIVAYGPSLVIQQDLNVLESMDEWNTTQHKKSGLWDKVLVSKTSLKDAELLTLNFIKQYTNPNRSSLCGNSIWQDRRFLEKYMPSILEHLHYRLIDVSSIKSVVERWYSKDFYYTKKESNHRALEDVVESINELRHYRQKIFIPC